jgi:hypothetical protein
MKALLTIIISLFIISSSFAQIYTQLFAAAEDSSTTYLFYRTNTVHSPNEYSTSYYIYRYDVSTWKEELFSQDWNYSSGGNTKVYAYTDDIEFINDQPDNYFTTQDSWSGGSGGYINYGSILKNNSSVFNSVGGGLNIESSKQNPQLLYASGGFGSSPDKSKSYMLKSLDGGNSWNYLETGFTLASLNKNNDSLLLGIKNNKLLLAANDTTLSYTTVDSIFTWNNYFTKFYYSTDKKHIYTTAMKDKIYNIVMSEDNGYTWKGIVASNKSIYVSIDKSKPTDVYYATGKSIFYSANNGSSFTTFNSLPDTLVGIYKKSNSDIVYAVTTKKRYKVTSSDYEMLLSSTVDVKKADNSVNDFSLLQNYPNPFNPTTKIEYKIGKAGFVSLKVYNVLGAEITTLVNKEELPGNYSVTFDGKNLPSGVYFYRLTSNKSELIHKMCLVK